MAPRKKKNRTIDAHAIDRICDRCHIQVDHRGAQRLLQSAEFVLRAANGDWLLAEEDGFYAILVRNRGVLKTAITLEHAFSNCPKALFCHLMTTGRMIPAFNLRTLYMTGKLPIQHGSDEGNYKYEKRKAEVLWEAFEWHDR